MSARLDRGADSERTMAGWGWLGLLRLGLALTVGLYALTYHAPRGHPAPGYVLPVTTALALLLVVLAIAQMGTRLRASRPGAVALLAVDAGVIVGTLALYSFDPRRYLLALVVVVQAEGGVVLGLWGGFVAWAVTSIGYVWVEGALAGTSGASPQVSEAAVRLAVGLLLAMAGGFLSTELSGERARRIAERERELVRLQEAEAKYRSLVERIPVVTYVDAMDQDGGPIYVSPQVEHVLGYTPAEWSSEPKLWQGILHPGDRDRVLGERARRKASGKPFKSEYRIVRKDGGVVWVRDEASPVPDEAGKAKVWQGVMVDVTEQKRAEEQVTFLAYHDKLTGLPNRVMFERLLDLALARARRSDLAVAVLYMDLDNFKLVNDSLGHAAGDELLRDMAIRLAVAVRDTDVVSREGGGEYLLLLADMARSQDGVRPVETAAGVATRIQEALEAPFVLSGTELYITASTGVSLFPDNAGEASLLLRQADAAMYRAKQQTTGRSTVFATEDSDPSTKRSLGVRLGHAIQANELVLLYQPIVDLRTRDLVAVEALLRWRQPDGSLLGPDGFIPLAEELNLIGPIGDWVVGEVCRQCIDWRNQGFQVDMSFNVPPRQLWQPDAVQKLLGAMRAAGADPKGFIVEITESTAMRDPDRTERVLQEMHGQGLRLAVDDFGTGYSSLARLRDLPVDLLTIDRRFVRDIPHDSDAVSMVNAVLGLARSLDMQPLAEGIETEEQLGYLVGRGCRLGQGYLFSPPVPAERIPTFASGGARALDDASSKGDGPAGPGPSF